MESEKVISRFRGWMEDKSMAFETVKSYVIEARVFLRYLDEHGLSVLMVKKPDILDYLSHQTHSGVGSRARNRTMYSVRALYECLLDYNLVEENPTSDLRRAKTEKNKQPTYLEQDALDDLLSVEDEMKYHNRNMLIMALMSYMGLRVGELVRLDLKEVDRVTKTLAVLGKGNTWRYVPIPEDLMLLLDEYLQERIDPVKEKEGSNPLFVSQFKKRMSRRTMQHLATSLFEGLIKKHPELIGVKLSAHKLRHTFATHQLREGTDLSTLQNLLGHTDISTTGIYVHTNKQQLVEAMKRVKINIKVRRKDQSLE